MTVFVGLLPALVLLGGALISVLPIPQPVRRWIPIGTCLAAAVALLFTARAPDPVPLLPPNEALPVLSLTLQWNDVALTYGLFMLLLLSGRVLLGMETDTRGLVFGSLVTAAGALLFFASDNVTTLAAAWILVELGLLVIPAEEDDTRQAAARAFGWNLAAILAWLTAGMLVSNLGGSLRLNEIALEGAGSFFVLIAVWIRSGIYPVQAAAPATASTIGMRIGLPLLLGGYLMTRFLMQTQGRMAFAAEMQILALLAIGASALVVVGRLHGGEALTWTLRAFSTMLLLLPFFVSARIAPSLSVWFALGGCAVCFFMELALQWRAELPRLRLTLVVWIVALVMVASLPLSPTFWSRVGLLASGYQQTGIILWLLLVATMALVLVPIWREVFASQDVAPRAPSFAEYLAFAFFVLPSLALTFVPYVFAAPFGDTVRANSGLAFDALFKPLNPGALVFLLAGLVAPVLASLELARRWDPRANLVPVGVTNFLDLTNLVAVFNLVYRFVRVLVQQALALLEQPPIAWLIFLVIWVAVWIIGLST